jgi:hypothetical protein
MRNVWKGLVVGGLTGVTAGVVLDSLARASRKASEIGAQVREHTPEAGRFVQSLAGKATDAVHNADVPGHVREAADKIADSEGVQRAARVSTDAVAKAKEGASSHPS